MTNQWTAWINNSLTFDISELQKKISRLKKRHAVPEEVRRFLVDIYQSQIDILKHNTRSDKSPSPPHTLEDGADTTTELVSGKSSGFIGGMR